jgi:TetR/AcrR family transcriptional regulator
LKPASPRPRDAELTREALLAAATARFARHGFEGVTVELIARDAKVNKAMINYYFGGKAGLYQAILTTTFAEITQRIDELRKSSRPPLEVLREFVAVFAEIATQKRPSFPALFLREALEGAPRARAVVLPYLRVVISSILDVIARGVREGSLRPVDPFLTHLTIVGSMVFFFATAPLREAVLSKARLPFPPPTTDAFVRHMQELITHGLARADGKTAGTVRPSRVGPAGAARSSRPARPRRRHPAPRRRKA